LSSGESAGRWIGPVDRMIKAAVLSPFVGQRLASFLARQRREDLQTVRELIEQGKLSPVIDRTYPLRETPEAIRHLEQGHARGKIVITV
jgi:NADPH:quinone reductase-like Zn-dependent oxidoreductase